MWKKFIAERDPRLKDIPYFYEEMLAILEKESAGIDLQPGRVPHTMLYGFINGEIIDRVSVRHELNENLRRRPYTFLEGGRALRR